MSFFRMVGWTNPIRSLPGMVWIRKGRILGDHNRFGKSKVDHQKVPDTTFDTIAWLDISMNNTDSVSYTQLTLPTSYRVYT